MDITYNMDNNILIWHGDATTGTYSKRCDGQTDGRTDKTIHRAAWPQLKNVLFLVPDFLIFNYNHILLLLFDRRSTGERKL